MAETRETIKEIVKCDIFDYGYIAEITTIIEQDGETHETMYTLTATSIY